MLVSNASIDNNAQHSASMSLGAAVESKASRHPADHTTAPLPFVRPSMLTSCVFMPSLDPIQASIDDRFILSAGRTRSKIMVGTGLSSDGEICIASNLRSHEVAHWREDGVSRRVVVVFAKRLLRTSGRDCRCWGRTLLTAVADEAEDWRGP